MYERGEEESKLDRMTSKESRFCYHFQRVRMRSQFIVARTEFMTWKLKRRMMSINSDIRRSTWRLKRTDTDGLERTKSRVRFK